VHDFVMGIDLVVHDICLIECGNVKKVLTCVDCAYLTWVAMSKI
jgi:hypothetical protein